MGSLQLSQHLTLTVTRRSLSSWQTSAVSLPDQTVTLSRPGTVVPPETGCWVQVPTRGGEGVVY